MSETTYISKERPSRETNIPVGYKGNEAVRDHCENSWKETETMNFHVK